MWLGTEAGPYRFDGNGFYQLKRDGTLWRVTYSAKMVGSRIELTDNFESLKPFF